MLIYCDLFEKVSKLISIFFDKKKPAKQHQFKVEDNN